MKSLLWIFFLGWGLHAEEHFLKLPSEYHTAILKAGTGCLGKDYQNLHLSGQNCRSPISNLLTLMAPLYMLWQNWRIKGWASACSWLFVSPPDLGVFENFRNKGQNKTPPLRLSWLKQDKKSVVSLWFWRLELNAVEYYSFITISAIKNDSAIYWSLFPCACKSLILTFLTLEISLTVIFIYWVFGSLLRSSTHSTLHASR